MARGDSQSGEQTFKMGYCKTEKKMTQFVSTLSPKGGWVCTTCPFRVKELLKIPILPAPLNFPYV